MVRLIRILPHHKTMTDLQVQIGHKHTLVFLVPVRQADVLARGGTLSRVGAWSQPASNPPVSFEY
jgi:hypothetical protein